MGIGGHAVAIAETDQRNEHGTLLGIFETLGDEVAEFVDIEFGGVDDHVRKLADRLHELALVAQAFAYGKMLAERMGTTRLAVPPKQGIFARVDENERNGMLTPHVLQ